MAGIFAPSLSESGTAIGVQSPIQSVDYSGLSKTFAGIVDSIGDDSDSTQKDRDNKALQPFARRMGELYKQRDALGARYRSLVKQEYNNFIADHPMLAGNAGELVNSVHGINLQNEITPQVLDYQNNYKFFTEDPAGQFLLTAAMSFDKDGNFDAEQTRMKAQSMRYDYLSTKHNLAAKKAVFESTEIDTKTKDNARKEAATDTMRTDAKAVAELAQTFIQGKGEFTGVDLSSAAGVGSAITTLDAVIVKTRALFADNAATIGKDYDMDSVMAPLTSLRETLTNNRDDIGKLESAMDAETRIKFGQYIQEKTGIPKLSSDPEYFKFLDGTFVRLFAEKNGDVVLDLMRSEEGKKLLTWDRNKIFSPEIDNTSSVAPDSTEGDVTDADPSSMNADQVFHPELVAEVKAMPMEERMGYILNQQLLIGALDKTQFQDQAYRERSANELVKLLAAGFVSESGGFITPGRIKSVLSPEVVEVYKEINKIDPIVGGRLQKAIASSFAVNVVGRANAIQNKLDSVALAKGLRWQVDGKNHVTLYYDINDPRLPTNTKQYLKAATDAGYNTTLDSLIEFDKYVFHKQLGQYRWKESVHSRLFDEVGKINEVTSVLEGQFPEIGKSEPWKKSIGQFFNREYSNEAAVIDATKATDITSFNKLISNYGEGTYIVYNGEGYAPVTIVIHSDGTYTVQ